VETGLGAPIQRAEAVGGGCIANATRIQTAGGPFFLKWAEGNAGARFSAEADGLAALRKTRDASGADLLVPEVLLTHDADAHGPGLLLMAWIEPGRPDAGAWSGFGEALAVLHAASAGDGRYGFPRDNSIGATPQPNTWMDRWPGFFRDRRLRPQIDLARQNGRWTPAWDAPADRLLARLDDLLPETPHASMLHGDLWSGNALATATGRFALIDPATYVGHAETDLALTELFGGFDRAFTRAYWGGDAPPGYAERREVYNLYHVLNHLNLFGGSYAAGVARTLERFG
jgi:fructosamine-3-kinase